MTEPQIPHVKIPADVRITPSTGFRLTLVQLIGALLMMGGAGYSVGIVRANQAAHEAQDGHPAMVSRVTDLELTQAKVAAVLERLESR